MKKDVQIILIISFFCCVFIGLFVFKYIQRRAEFSNSEPNNETLSLINIDICQISGILDQIYTGDEIIVPVNISINGNVLRENIDYILSYSNNVDVGLATIKIVGIGDYTGEKTVSFNIINNDAYIEPQAIITCQNKIYNGNNQTIATCSGGTISNEIKKNVGSYLVKCQGDNNHRDAVPVYCYIGEIVLSDATISKVEDQKYTGKNITPTPTVKLGNTLLTKDRDYILNYKNNINVGIATIKIVGIGNYTGEKTVFFNIIGNKSNVNPQAIITCQNKTYNGNNQTIATCSGGTISNEIKKNVGSYLVKCQGDNNHRDAPPKHCYIGEIVLSDAIISKVGDQKYTGKNITPTPTVKLGNTLLTKDKDYILYYKNNINVGIATIKIVGIGNYTGEKTVFFNIIGNKSNVKPQAIITCQNKTYNGNNQTIATCSGGTISNAINKDAGSYTVRCQGDSTHSDAQAISCLINAANISNASISIIDDQVYTGKNITPIPTVKFGNIPLIKDKDYTIKYTSNINIGTATIKIVGIGNYTGTKTIDFQIVEDESQQSSVKEIQLRDVSFKDLSKVIAVNSSIIVTPYMRPETANNQNLTWTSSDNSIATVSSTGRVIGRKEGKVTITAVATVKDSRVDDARVVSSYDLYVCNAPINSNGEINNTCFGIKTGTKTDSIGEQNSKGITAAINYSMENAIKSISLKKGQYYVKAIQFSNSGVQKYPFAIFVANNTDSNLNLNLNNSTLLLMTNNYTRGSMIYIGETSNITISNGTLIGDSKTHKCSNNTDWITNQTCAESYHGVYVHSATNVRLDNLIMYDIIGDGVYIYGSSKNINILNSIIHDTGRNSVTATFGDTINIKGNIFYNNNWGIKTEPTVDQYRIDQFPVKNLTIQNNTIYSGKYHASVYLDRTKNVIISGNRIGDIIASGYCGSTRDESDPNIKCFAGNEINEVKVSNNTVYVVKNNTYVAPEIVNINCISGRSNCLSGMPWIKIDGDWYRINIENGTLVRNQWIKGTGTGDKKGKWYYVNGDGKRYINVTVKINGEDFTFDSTGICTKGSICT